MRLSVIIPCFNERDTLRGIVDLVRAQPTVSQLIVVDDGSTDGSREIAREMQKAHPDIIFLFAPRNEGKGSAVRLGLTAVKGDVVIIQDADFEYDPGDYPSLLEPMKGGALVVYGSRFARGGSDASWHVFGNRFLTWLSNLFTGRHLTDMETCYKAIRTPVIMGLPLRERGFGLEPEITGWLCRKGIPIREVPIRYKARTYAEGKKIGWRDAIRTTYVILKIALSR